MWRRPVTETLSKVNITVRKSGEQILWPCFYLFSSPTSDFLWPEARGHIDQPLGAQSRVRVGREEWKEEIQRSPKGKDIWSEPALSSSFLASHLFQLCGIPTQEIWHSPEMLLGFLCSCLLASLLLSSVSLCGEHITFLKQVWILRVEATYSISKLIWSIQRYLPGLGAVFLIHSTGTECLLWLGTVFGTVAKKGEWDKVLFPEKCQISWGRQTDVLLTGHQNCPGGCTGAYGCHLGIWYQEGFTED